MKKKLKEHRTTLGGGMIGGGPSSQQPHQIYTTGYSGSPRRSADDQFSSNLKQTVPVDYYEEDEDTEDLLIDEDEYSEDEDMSEFSGVGAVAGYTGPLQAPKNPKKFYKDMNIYKESVVLSRALLRKLIIEEISKINFENE